MSEKNYIKHLYTLTDPRGDIRYVGATTDVSSRVARHIVDSRDPKRNSIRDVWVRELLTEGLRPILNIIDTANSETWQEKEMYYISLYRAMGCDLVNSTDGGVGGLNPIAETRRKRSEAQTGELNHMYGKSPSEEHRRKNSEANRGENNHMYGKHHSEESRRKIGYHKKKPIIQYSLDGSFVCVWDGAIDAEKGLSTTRQCITACCRGKRKSAGGYIWRYADDPLLDNAPAQLSLDFE